MTPGFYLFIDEAGDEGLDRSACQRRAARHEHGRRAGEHGMEIEGRSRCEAYAGAERGGITGDPGVRYEGVLDQLEESP